MADKNNPPTLIYCFLDTNILIEFQTFDEVEWPQLLNAQQVCLVLAPIVVYELDKHKSDYSNTRLQKRARMLLSKLNKLLDVETPPGELPQVRRNVTLMTLKEPSVDWKAEGLDPNVPDDRLIASILDFRREHPSDEVCLLSDDSGPRFKAKPYNITTLAPKEGSLRHIEPPTPEEVEIKELKKQLQVLTDRMPILKFGFYENEQVVHQLTRPTNILWHWQTPEDFAADEIARKREELNQMLARVNSSVQEDEVSKFTEEYEKYLTELEPALKMQFIKEYAPSCRLKLALVNEGTAPANDVAVYIAFPNGSSIVTISDLNDEVNIKEELPNPPPIPTWAQPPKPKWLIDMESSLIIPYIQRMVGSINMANSLFYSPGISVPRRNTYYSYTFPFGQNTLAEKISKLSHHRQVSIGAMIAYLPPKVHDGFKVTYSVMADELLEPIKGELNVRWE